MKHVPFLILNVIMVCINTRTLAVANETGSLYDPFGVQGRVCVVGLASNLYAKSFPKHHKHDVVWDVGNDLATFQCYEIQAGKHVPASWQGEWSLRSTKTTVPIRTRKRITIAKEGLLTLGSILIVIILTGQYHLKFVSKWENLLWNLQI